MADTEITTGEVVDDSARRAWLYLSVVAERPTAAIWDLVDLAGPVEAAERIRCGRVTSAVEQQTSARRSVDIDAVDAAARLVDARFLCPEDPRWPHLALAGLDLPRSRARRHGRSPAQTVPLRPFGLWWRGPAEPQTVAERSAALVGTRAATSYGRAVTADLAIGLVAEQVTIVSGGAFGIDAAAHRAALGAAGTTVAVLACGVDQLYPRGNAQLLLSVAEHGALVTEYPPGSSPARFRFLDRNRLIAALSRATVVVEAAARSGALSTAGWARGMGRPTAAVPGPVTSVASLGCHHLVREREAVLVTRADQVLELAGRMGETERPGEHPGSPWDGLDDITRRVLEALPLTGGVPVERVAFDSALPPAQVRAVLGRLAASQVVVRSERGWRRRGGGGHQLELGW